MQRQGGRRGGGGGGPRWGNGPGRGGDGNGPRWGGDARSFEQRPQRPRRPPPDRTPQPLPPLELLFATGNAKKLAELRELAEPTGLTIRDGTDLPEVVEDGATFVDNARKKAVAAVLQTGLSALADDSGLLVDALDGAPGVLSARYGGPPTGDRAVDDARNIEKLLEALGETPDDARGAHFACALVLAGPLADGPGALHSEEGVPYRAFFGRSFGRILREKDGDGGFGYDPVFFSEDLGCTFAIASAAEKHSVSHRGRAFAALLPALTALRTRDEAPSAPLFLRPLGLEALVHALAETIGGGLRYAVRGLESALSERPGLGAKERAAVAALHIHALRRLGVLQLASGALLGEALQTPDPRRLRPRDAGVLAVLTLADVDEKGSRLPHRGPGERSALTGLLERHTNLIGHLPSPASKIDKALRTATHALDQLPGDAGAAIAAGVHPELYAALVEAFGVAGAGRVLDYLAEQGPPTLRLTRDADADAVLSEISRLGARTVRLPEPPGAVALLSTARITVTEAFHRGDFEMQDAGSQHICTMAAVQPGMRVADWCAGAGGKTLALADALQGEGEVVALDVHDGRLREAQRRVARAGVQDLVRIERHTEDAEADARLGDFDVVLVDAPCSSTGALRRTPELRWHTDAAWLQRFPEQQRAIALRAAARVRPGGRLVYATCSLMPAENEAVVHALAEELGWPLVAEQRIGPSNPEWLALGPLAQIGPDGFYSAAFERPHG